MEAHSFARSDGGRIVPRSRKLLGAFGDDRLVAQLRRGNDAAFEVLYDRHQAGVLSYCRHMLGSQDEAEDALQQAFVSAHADIVSSEKPIRFKAWIYTIARNRCLSTLRARRERPSDELERVSTEGLGEEVQRRAELRELLSDMQELPDDQRTALILSELGDLSHAEVAEVIECEVAKVKSLVFQARSGLMERREARETPCAEIREQLATLRGGSLRRGPLRRHLKACPGCAEFRDEVRRQRQMVAAVLPVVPTLALKENALAAVGISATSAGGGALMGGGAGAVFAAKTGVAKVAVIAAATTGAVGGAVVVEQKVADDGKRGGGAGEGHQAGAAAGVAGTATGAGPGSLAETLEMSITDAGLGPSPAKQDAKGSGGAGAGSGDKAGDELILPFGNGTPGAGAKQGFTPVPGGSNGAEARDFATGQGEGNHNGLHKPHPAPEKNAGRDQAAGDGAAGNPNAGPKPKKAKPDQAKETPEGAGAPVKNQAQPAPEPEPGESLVPTLVPGLADPKAKEDRPEQDARGKPGSGKNPGNGNSHADDADASALLAP
jgi:RNA polymerase sigma factor (sigma-70 family)